MQPIVLECRVSAGPAPGDFRLAWQDNRTGAVNTWYTTSADGGAGWPGEVKLSNLTSGAPYKSPAGYTFPDGDNGAICADHIVGRRPTLPR